ncbi:MAG: CAP domain-containing protein [Planctomycetes bacterium]|nr:CAP domain-containing protein [Planctomycetota bacterium]MCB9903406.1 CAP domain-containing protein [Planctomycetota bacterium]
MSRSALLVCSLLVLVACSGGKDVSRAEHQIGLGNLEVAESYLAGNNGPDAERLRQRIALVREKRAALRAAIDGTDAVPADEALVTLEDLLASTDFDPIAKSWVESAVSSAHDRVAEEKRGSSHERAEYFVSQAKRGARELHGQSLEEAIVEGDGEQLAVLDGVYDDVREAIATHEWRIALAALDMVAAPDDGAAAELRRLRLQAREGAREEAEALLATSRDLEANDGLAAALAALQAEAQRFPRGGDTERLFTELDELRDRLELIALAEASDPGALPEREFRSDAPLHIQAGAYERVGELAQALDLWTEAGLKAGPGDDRDNYMGRARWVEKRLALRQALQDAFAVAPDAFRASLADSIGFEGIERGGKQIPWRDVELGWFRRAVELAKLGDKGRVGLLAEAFAQGDFGAVESELAVLLGAGAIDEFDAWSLLARRRGEPIPAGGYVYLEKRWISSAEADDKALRLALEKYETALVRAKGEKREEALEALLAHGVAARGVVVAALEERFRIAAVDLQRDPALKKFEKLAEQRRELDAARETALALIFDEEEYFYPYRPPECPPQKARLYPAVQRRVDELVEAVREVWDNPKSAKPSSGLESSLDELNWCMATAKRVGASLSLPPELPGWVFHIDLQAKSITLHTFAWNEGERQRFERDAQVAAFNERLWDKLQAEDPSRAANASEREQVTVTNDYRRMFGRRALAWNPLLQDAAQMHSDYMSETGDFGHYEAGDPNRRTPFDRMQLVGYTQGASENCSMGRSGPVDAHLGWLQSSGHHRNILTASHQEMASALAGVYWTQNYGTGTSFTSEL